MSLIRRFPRFLLRLLPALPLALLPQAALAADPLQCANPQPGGATPPGVTLQTLRNTAADGTCLQGYMWTPKEGRPRGVVVVVHGIRDHASRYQALTEALANQQIAVVAQDHRGHGNSGGARQRFDSVEQLVADVHLAVEESKRRYRDVPVFVFGHSMGGLTGVHYALAYPKALKGVVLSGPALKLGDDATAGKRIVVRVLGRIWPSLAIQKVDDSVFVRTDAAKRAQAGDPLIFHDDLPAASVLTFLQGIESAQERFERYATPLLALHGAADRSTDPQGSRDLVERAGVKDKSLRLVPEAAHDLLHEPEAPILIKEIVAWIADRL